MSCCTSVEPIRFPIDMSKQSDILRVSSNLIRFEMKIKYKLIENIRITHRGHLQKPLIADSHTRGENALSRWKCVKRKISYFCVWKYTTKKNPLLKIVELSALRAYVFLSILRFSSSRFAFHSKFTSYFSFFSEWKPRRNGLMSARDKERMNLHATHITFTFYSVSFWRFSLKCNNNIRVLNNQTTECRKHQASSGTLVSRTCRDFCVRWTDNLCEK